MNALREGGFIFFKHKKLKWKEIDKWKSIKESWISTIQPNMK